MSGGAHVNYTVACMLAMGGIMGFAIVKSVPSVVAGISMGGVYAVSGYMIEKGEPANGYLLGAGASVVLTSMMGYRMVVSKRGVPAAMTLVGLSAGIYNILKWSEWSQ